jgi:predicted DNA-binding transcriptional regulator AlpA
MQSIMSVGAGNGDQFLPARKVWERYGVTSMTLWRWIHDDKLKFPRPVYILRFRYWRLNDLVTREQSSSSAQSEVNHQTR